MFIFNQWEVFCRELSELGINSTTAMSLLDDNDLDEFLVLKHDVETNPKKALELAKIENKYNHKGTYYVQGYLLNNKKNISILKEIMMLGHEVSYHHDVMDANEGNIDMAKKEFEEYLELFRKNNFAVHTVCQHGNPIVERKGYTSNRDFFRNSNIRKYFSNIFEMMVNFKEHINKDYNYISDAGYSWKVIYNPENNDVIDSSEQNIDLYDLDRVLNYIKQGGSVIISTHPHRWNDNLIKAKIKNGLFVGIKKIVKVFLRVPIIKKVFSRYYYLAKKI